MTEETEQREVKTVAESSMEQTAEMPAETISNNLEVGNEMIHPHKRPQVTNAHASTQLHEDSSRETRPRQNTIDIQGLSKTKQLQETDQPIAYHKRKNQKIQEGNWSQTKPSQNKKGRKNQKNWHNKQF